MQRRLDNSKGILRLWTTWLLGSGMLTLLILLSLWVRPLYMPFVAYGLQLILFILIRRNRLQRLPTCYIFPFVVSRTLFWSGTVMLIINFLHSRWLFHIVFDPATVNPDIPFITTLIVTPISAIISFWARTHKASISFCRDCRMRAGTAAERGFLGMIYTREGQYQILVVLIISVCVATIAWLYYALTYINTSLNRPDRFVFFWGEFFLCLAAGIYFGLRYLGIWGYYCQDVEGSSTRHGRSTQLRYIIIADDLIALRPPHTGADMLIPGTNYYDTPVSVTDNWRENISLPQAIHAFDNLSNIEDADVRFFYSNTRGNADCNIFHFFAFFSPEDKANFSKTHPDCEWVTFRELANLINEKHLNPLMSAEITRLYTMAMAWKTYDRQGRRRYKIKHYRPTFHVKDIKNWDIDYNDSTWLYIADNNQDVPFYHLRRLWRKYINGVGNYIDELSPTDQSQQ